MNRIEKRISMELQGWKRNEFKEPEGQDLVDILAKNGCEYKNLYAEEVDWEDKNVVWWKPSECECADEHMESKPDFHGEFEKMSEEKRDEIINPKHYELIPASAYKQHPDGLEYMDLMTYILAHHNGVRSHLLGQIFKYAVRLGKKDADLQDAKKIQWYANYLVKVIEEEGSLND